MNKEIQARHDRDMAEIEKGHMPSCGQALLAYSDRKHLLEIISEMEEASKNHVCSLDNNGR